MLRKKNWLIGLAAGVTLAFTSTASAQTPPAPMMNLNEGIAQHDVVGWLVVAPYFTHPDGVFTSILVTNATDTDTVLHLHVLDGDYGSNWGEQDIYCGMTPNETTMILFQDTGIGPRMKVECSNEGRTSPGGRRGLDVIVDRQPGTVEDLPVAGQRGMLVINQREVGQEQFASEVERLISDWTVVDLYAGTTVSAESLHFQGGSGAGTTDRSAIILGNTLPAVFGASFYAPTPGGEIATEILLLALDGKPGTPPRQAVDGYVYNDDEVKQSWQTREWECMDLFRLTDLDPTFVSTELCDEAPLGCVGHIVLNPIPVSVGGSIHDAPFGDYGGANSEGFRQSFFDGWILHRYSPGGPLAGLEPMANRGTTARILNRVDVKNDELPGDVFGLDLR